MKTLTTLLLAAALALPLGMISAPSAEAGSTIERACMSSNRRAASRPLCDCIQRVADQMLTRRDQRMAAKFFKDPHRAQEVRQSDRASDEAFWKRYKAFGTTAGNVCS
ncbi:hypothetical protein [Tropicimonas sediminicola]|uniref:Arginine transporter n=1 Tax=Tropicimonas sediminicola TaxID=1031541 RepID=A0A239CPQ3_9RHOB|nr:hypothetical protein [Tropicimonas sediminicola]SNS21748.1 hypothetical protein SAMN05421757_101392 [Tropicimonas sediminicola]